MCPLAQLSWTDEQIIQLLDECSHGSSLPSNVLADSSPYQFPPACLPVDSWYLVQSNSVKESDFGFWETNEEACKIYSCAMMSGWRTTLRYFEGKKPHGKRTNWLMQEYKIMQEGLLDKNKIIKDARLLCRVFLSSESTCNPEISLCCKPLIEMEQKNPVALSITSPETGFFDDSKSESKEKNCVVKSVPAPDKETNASLEVFSEQECFSRGDFMELNDLDDPESHSSSSQNSSCPSKLSDEYFDSLALLRDLEEEGDKYLQEQSSSICNFMASTHRNDIVMHHPASSGCLLSGATTTSVEQASETADLPKSTGGSVLEHTTKRHKPESQTEGPSTSSNEATSPSSSSDKDTKSNGEKKAGSGRMKKLKMYLCLSLF